MTGPRRKRIAIAGIAPEHVRVEMPVEIVFEGVTENVALPKFRPLK